MGLKDLIANGVLVRRLLKASERQADAMERIAASLEQMAGVIAPPLTEATPEDLRLTAVNFTRDAEQLAIQRFVETFERTFNREPTDDEIMEHLVERV